MRNTSLLFLSWLALVLLCGPALAGDAPEDTVKTFNAALQQAMRVTTPGDSGRQERVGIIGPAYDQTFAWRNMGRVAAGGGWNAMADADKERYLAAYRDWSVATYAQRFQADRGQKFEVDPATLDDDKATALVASRILRPAGPPVELTYALRATEQGQWRIMDIRVRGVSQLALTRAQFSVVLDKDGLPGLLAMLSRQAQNPGAEP